MLSKPNAGGPVRLKFNDLPREIRERLLARQRSDAETYNFELESLPAKTIFRDGDYDETDAARKDFIKVLERYRDTMYDSMAASAFEDFRASLVFRRGIGDDKKLNINIPAEDQAHTSGGEGDAGPSR